MVCGTPRCSTLSPPREPRAKRRVAEQRTCEAHCRSPPHTQGVGDAFRNIRRFRLRPRPDRQARRDGIAPFRQDGVHHRARHNLITSGQTPLFQCPARARVARAYLDPSPTTPCPASPMRETLADLTAGPPSWPGKPRRIQPARLRSVHASQDWAAAGRSGAYRHSRLSRQRRNLDLRCFASPIRVVTTAIRRPEPARGKLPRRLASACGDPTTRPTGARGNSPRLFKALTRGAPTLRLSTLPPGASCPNCRLAGATFAPLDAKDEKLRAARFVDDDARRYEAYKTHVARPFSAITSQARPSEVGHRRSCR